VILEQIFTGLNEFDLDEQSNQIFLIDDKGNKYESGDCWKFSGFVDGIYLRESGFMYKEELKEYNSKNLELIAQEFFDNQALSRIDKFISPNAMKAYHLNKRIQTQLDPIENLATDYGVVIDHQFILRQNSDAKHPIAQNHNSFEQLIKRSDRFVINYTNGFNEGNSSIETIDVTTGERFDLRNNIRIFYESNKLFPGFDYHDIMMATDESNI